MLFGLGLPEWLTIISLLGGLILTFYIMAKASVAYERKRQARESEAGSAGSQNEKEKQVQEPQEENEQS